MKIKPWLLATMVILALAGVRPTAPAGALSATSSVDSRLRLDWEVGARHGGRPVIQGYLYNDYLRSAAEVQLLVETLDASGAVTSRQRRLRARGHPLQGPRLLRGAGQDRRGVVPGQHHGLRLEGLRRGRRGDVTISRDGGRSSIVESPP